MATKNQKVVSTEKSEFVVTKISPKGINAVIKNVTLNWVFIARPAQDKDDPLKASYRTQMILRGGEKEFVNSVKTALIQYMKSAAVAWGGDVREKVLKNALTIDVDKSLFKQTEFGISMNCHQTVRRETELDEFIAKYPPVVRLANNEECPASMIVQEFYSGVVADVAVFISAFEVDAGRGVTIYLNGVRKVGNGERLAGADPFADVPTSVMIEDTSKKPLLV